MKYRFRVEAVKGRTIIGLGEFSTYKEAREEAEKIKEKNIFEVVRIMDELKAEIYSKMYQTRRN